MLYPVDLVGPRYEHGIRTERVRLPFQLELKIAAQTERDFKTLRVDMGRRNVYRLLEGVEPQHRQTEHPIRLEGQTPAV